MRPEYKYAWQRALRVLFHNSLVARRSFTTLSILPHKPRSGVSLPKLLLVFSLPKVDVTMSDPWRSVVAPKDRGSPFEPTHDQVRGTTCSRPLLLISIQWTVLYVVGLPPFP